MTKKKHKLTLMLICYPKRWNFVKFKSDLFKKKKASKLGPPFFKSV